MNDKELKLAYLLLNIVGIILILFIAIFNGCLFGIEPQRLETSEGLFGLLFAIFIPLLLSGYCFIIANWKCKSFTKKDAIRQNEKQLKNGIITQEQYISNVKVIERNAIEKRNFEQQMNSQRAAFEKEVLNEAAKGAKLIKEVEENV